MNIISKNRFEEILNEFKNISPIIVLGDVGIDKYTYGSVNRISPEAPVPVLEVEREWHKLGLAANVTDNLRSLSVQSTLCGVIGNDSNGSLFDSLLEEEQLSTWGIVRCQERPTTFKERVTTELQQICRIDYESKSPVTTETITKLQHRMKDFGEQHSTFIFEDYGKGVFSRELTEKIINRLKDQGKLICVDPSRSTDPEVFRDVSLIKPNKIESQLMVEKLGFSNEPVEKRLEIIAEKLNIEKVIITLGAHGMAMLDKSTDGKVKIIPTLASEVFDVSGAGDTAISAISASLACGSTLEEAAWIGNFASGVVVGKVGTATVDQIELKKFYEKVSLNLEL